MALLLINLWPLQQLRFGQEHKNAKVGTKVCQILNKPCKNCPKTFKIKWRNFAKSRHTGEKTRSEPLRLTRNVLTGQHILTLRKGGSDPAYIHVVGAVFLHLPTFGDVLKTSVLK